MKKFNIYIVAVIALAFGLLLGWLLFNSDAPISHEKIEQTTSEDASEIWTCSMHPQIRQNEAGDCPLCGMDLIPAAQTTSSASVGFQMTEAAIKLANIQTTSVSRSENTNGTTLKLNGKIQANESKSASIVSHIPGRIEKLYVSFTGEKVNKGQKIASIYSPDVITAQKELLEAKKIEDLSPGLLNAAKNKLGNWKISDAVIADILQSGTIKESFLIYSDHSGIVDKKRVSVGDYLSTGEVLFDVQNLNNLWALFDVYENDLPKISIGKKIRFTTPSAPNKSFHANITFVNPVINPKTRVATIRAEVNNTGGKLKPEMFITGEFTENQNSSHLTIPKSAVLWTGLRSVVYVKVADAEIPSFEYREIELGNATQKGYAVMSGLEIGEEVVTNGAFVIDASAQLNNQNSMMNENVRAKNEVAAQNLPDYTATTPIVFKEQLSQVANTYIVLKDALVDSNTKEAKPAVQDVLNSIEKVDSALIKNKAHNYWMEQLKNIQSHGANIKATDDLEEQRKQFKFLSEALINSLKVFGLDNGTFYVQHCPMVNGNEGADWLSKSEKILNPYFGEKMLTCGLVQDTIDKDFKNSASLETE